VLDLSKEQRIELLTEAVIAVYEWLGCPFGAEQTRRFDREVDAVYRSFLMARSNAPSVSFTARMRALAALVPA